MAYIICTSLLYSHTVLWWSYCRHTSTTSAAPKYCYTTSWNSHSQIKLANSHDMLPILPKDPTKSHIWTYFLVDGIQSEHRVMVKLLTKEWCETTANLSMSHVYTSHLSSLATGHCLSFYIAALSNDMIAYTSYYATWIWLVNFQCSSGF